ncbi:MAG: hypothetical protein J0H55_01605 [Chitinophagaceae bacterium]|nr:hypothetical protein [Chitinophagaceae bacterium]
METLINLLYNASCSLLFFIGLGIRLLIGMRQFNRRGLGGLQHFNNYFVGLITLSIEWVLKWAASSLMLWGLWGWFFK